MTAEANNRTNYIFVDYENVQDVNLDLIAGKAVKVFLLVGLRRKTLPAALARQIHRYHDQVAWIESEGASNNALDLVLAYHVGLQSKADPNGYFHILSKDKDYDALIKHLRNHDVRASRDEVFAKIPVLVNLSRLSLDQRVEYVVERLKKSTATRPSKRKTLLTTIHALFHKDLSDTEVEQIVGAMVKRKMIELSPTQSVTYRI